jgi:hypothetical protein
MPWFKDCRVGTIKAFIGHAALQTLHYWHTWRDCEHGGTHLSRQLINEYRADLDRLKSVSGSRRENVCAKPSRTC